MQYSFRARTAPPLRAGGGYVDARLPRVRTGLRQFSGDTGLRSRVSWNRVSWNRVSWSRGCCDRGERLSAAAVSGTRVARLDSTISISHVVTRARPSGRCDRPGPARGQRPVGRTPGGPLTVADPIMTATAVAARAALTHTASR